MEFNAADRAAFWQGHVSTWQASGLSQRAYCREQKLNSNTFGYWVRKVRQADEGVSKAGVSGFAPVAVVATGTVGLVLVLPNGMEIRNIAPDNMALVQSLLEQLR